MAAARSPFGALLRQIRRAAGLSQEALAERASMSVEGVSALERGTRKAPQRETLQLLLGALDPSAEERAQLEAAAYASAHSRALPSESAARDGTRERHNLPLTLTRVFGRDADIEALRDLLRAHRIVTLTGTGGVGKTRLAIETARSLVDEFSDGVSFVELAALSEPELVGPQIAAVIGASVVGDRSVQESILAALRHRNTLLIVDNCEHLLEAAALLVDRIARSTERVTILATSRQALGIDGERVYRVASLSTPAPDEPHDSGTIAAYGAVQLFVDRSRAATGDFVLTNENAASVAQICRRLDGIPLATELAAPKIAVLTPRQLASSLDERFRILTGGSRTALPRQQTMRAMIDWSYDLLDDGERALFRELSVFAGGWTLDAAAAICGDGSAPWQVFEKLEALVAKSLVTAETVDDAKRYALLGTTRDYARERLEERSERDGVAARHARYYTAFLRERRALVLERMEDRVWRHDVLGELDNLRVALEWTLGMGKDPRLGLELLAEFHLPSLVFQPDEALRRYELGLEAVSVAGDARLEAAIRHRYALVRTVGRSDAAGSIAAAEAALFASRSIDDPLAAGEALKVLALALRDAGRLDEAEAAYREAWRATEPRGAVGHKASILGDWAANDLKRGDIETARSRFLQTLEIARRGSMVHANALASLGELEFASGDAPRARASAQEACLTFRALGARLHLGGVLCNLAAYALALDEFDQARAAMREALTTLRDIGSTYYSVVALEHHGVLAALTGRDEIAAELLGYTDRQHQALGQIRDTTERVGFERALGALDSRLGAARLQPLLARGALLSEDAARTLATLLQGGEASLQTEP